MSGDSPFPLFGDVTAPSDKASLAAETTWAAYLRADDAVVERPPSSDVGGGGIGREAADIVDPETLTEPEKMRGLIISDGAGQSLYPSFTFLERHKYFRLVAEI